MVLPLKRRNCSSAKNHGKHKSRLNDSVDFVLAYNRSQRKVTVGKDDGQLVDDETERRLFYSELNAHGILVNIDDDPTVIWKKKIVLVRDWFVF